MCKLKESASSAARQVYNLHPASLFTKRDKTAEASAARPSYKCLWCTTRMYQLTLSSRQAKGYWYTIPWLESSTSATLNELADTADLARNHLRDSKTRQKINDWKAGVCCNEISRYEMCCYCKLKCDTTWLFGWLLEWRHQQTTTMSLVQLVTCHSHM